MLMRYMKGEKIYIEETAGEMAPYEKGLDLFNDKHFVRHNELIRALNAIFQQAEENPENVSRDLSNLIYNLILLSKEKSHKPKIEVLNVASKVKEGFKFDGNAKVKRFKRLMLHAEKRVEIYDKPEVIHGGLYKPSEASEYLADDIISDEFKKWQHEQRGQNNNPEVTT